MGKTAKQDKSLAPLLSFRVHPDSKFYYCEVNVWPSKKAMYAHLPLQRNHEAACGARESIDVFPSGRTRRTGLFAEANFYRKRLGVEIISHEFTHAAFAFAERKRWDLNAALNHDGQAGETMDRDGTEEMFCYALGRMVRQFTAKLYEQGFYGDVVAAK